MWSTSEVLERTFCWTNNTGLLRSQFELYISVLQSNSHIHSNRSLGQERTMALSLSEFNGFKIP